MLSKRRITVTHVDKAVLCGGEGRFHHVVSIFNGADHSLKTPVPSEEAPVPAVSRLMAHTFHGAVEVDVQLSATDEYVLSAGANEAGVVACRLCPAPPSTGFSTATAWRAPAAHRLAFFSGRQRLAEVVLDAEPVANLALAETSPMTDARAHTPEAWQATYNQWRQVCDRFPIHCVRAAHGVDVALFVAGPRVLCACTPQASKEQYLTFERSAIACIGAGRQGRGEATVLLEDGTLLLCGVAAPHKGGQPEAAASSQNDGSSMSRESSLYRVRESFAGAPTSASPSHRPQTVPLSAPMTAEANRLASAYLADTASAADRASELSVLSVRTLLPRTASPSTSSSSPSSRAPQQFIWAGQQTLWVVYADGVVRAFWWPAADHPTGAEPEQRSEGEVQVVFEGRLGQPQATSAPDQVVLSTDARTPALHYGYRCGDGADFHYGSFKLSYAAGTSTTATTAPAYLHTASLEFTALFSEAVYGLRLHAGRFHVLSQARRGASPLYVSGLPRGNPLQAAAQAGMDPAKDLPLHQHILWDPESQLAAHCQRCAAQLAELGEGEATGAPHHLDHTEAGVQQALAQLQTITHSIHALLLRGREAGSVPSTDSFPFQLLQRAQVHAARLAASQLLLRCAGPAALQTPLHAFLDLAAARARSQQAQAALQALLDASALGSGASQGTTEAVDTRPVPGRTSLCFDVLLRQLPHVGAVLDESRLTLASVLSASPTMTPALALFVVYCSYQGLGERPTTAAQEAWRLEFLARFGQPVSWCGWAALAYAADHHVPLPTAAAAATSEETETAADDEEAAASTSVMAARLGLAHQLGIPPCQALLAPLVSGLMQSGAFDAAFHVVGTLLACHPQDLPPALAQKLLFLAVQAGSTAMVEQLYVASRASSASDGRSGHGPALATHALALAALAAQARETSRAASGEPAGLLREACLEPLRGLVAIVSPEASVVEAALLRHPDILQREHLLLRFYTLTQRYADAVHTCQRIASVTPAEAQRVQVVASYLASLCPYENPEYMSRRSHALAGSAAETASTLVGAPAPWHPLHTLTRVAPTPLESTDQDLRRQLALTVRRLNPSAASTRAVGSGLVISGTVPVTAGAAGAGERVLRPSALLTSLDRVPTSSERSSTIAGRSGLAPPPHHSRRAHNEEEEENASEALALDVSTAHSTNGRRPRPEAEAPHSPEAVYMSGFNRGHTCEAIVQRSGKICGRERPCPYHDKK